jgi:hypothetical protein
VYGIDYVDMESLETQEDAYLITGVFSGGTSEEKIIQQIRHATSNLSGDNTISLYYRVNNGAWELLRTISNGTDTITA